MVEDKYEAIQRISRYLELISQTNSDYLIGSRNNTQLNFSRYQLEIRKIIDDATSIYKAIQNDSSFLVDFSFELLKKAEGAALSILTQLDSMNNFIRNHYSLRNSTYEADKQREIANERDEIINNFIKAHNQFEEATSPIVVNLKYKEQNIKDNQALNRMSRNSEEIITNEYTRLFQERITSHQRASFIWLVFSIFALVVTMYSAWIMYMLTDINSQIKEGEYLKFIEHISLKIILFSLAAYTIHSFAKFYRLNKNLQILYQTKLIALKTYGHFKNIDEELGPAILLQVTNTIIGHQPNGYIDTQDEPITSPVEFLKLLKDSKSQ